MKRQYAMPVVETSELLLNAICVSADVAQGGGGPHFGAPGRRNVPGNGM